MSWHEGTLLVIDELLMTEAAAAAAGNVWLAENPYHALPLAIVYLDAVGAQQVVLVGRSEDAAPDSGEAA